MRKVKFEDLIADIEFYVECPECNKELIINNIFKNVRCPHCGCTFKPHLLLARKKTHKNPSFRGFSAGEEAHGKERSQVS